MATVFATKLQYTCYISAKIMAAFSPCPKNFPEAKFKSNEIISLVEENSRQSNIESAGLY